MEEHIGYDRRPENPPLSPIPSDSHIARAHASMHRHVLLSFSYFYSRFLSCMQAYPYCDGGVEGLFFVCSSRSLKDMDDAMERMSGASHADKKPDNLFAVTKYLPFILCYYTNLN